MNFLPQDVDSDVETSPTSKRGYDSNPYPSTNKISAVFADISKMSGDPLSFPEYLDVAHELNQMIEDEDNISDKKIDLSDFIPEQRSLL